MTKNQLFQKYAMEDLIKTYDKILKHCDYTHNPRKTIKGKQTYIKGQLKDLESSDSYKNYIKGM